MTKRRWLFRITLCLVLGVVTTVAVAWGFALSDHQPQTYVHGQEVDSPRLWARYFPGVPQTPRDHIRVMGRDASGSLVLAFHYESPTTVRLTEFFSHIFVTKGWPCQALYSKSSADGDVGTSLGDGRWLPTVPIPNGFAINTVFYATIWFVLLIPIESLKRYNCTRRGLCPMCKYDLRALITHEQDARATIGCPECGWNREAASQ